ncbi:MAG: Asp-tRNA(Asn)/Glu-tRNA(Gln) amidotransferase subunit GatC [Candidatus Gracilibacteria bacterium]|jgi:aspartyl/glutamyl-tRNA(Asn/Gln) amidotransferase C subunit|nr:Asp-tRNA(Asn)/Glu-tRNA(Gln) amidotransferase subunit GatC [Candidatus Gracilibacteria bacterium]
MVDEKVVSHLAKLSRIGLTEAETKRLSKDLSSVFEYMEVISEVKTDDLPEISQVNGRENVLEDDEVLPADCEPSSLLSASSNETYMNQIKVKKVI